MKIYNYFKNMAEGNISQEFRLKNINKTKNYLIDEINLNELIGKKHRKICTILNYIKHFLILASTITGCISTSDFTSLIGIPIGIMSSPVRLKTCETTAGTKKYKSVIKKKEKKHDKIVSLAKSKLNRIEVLISKSLIDLNISHDEFALINNVLK